jgi:hypothetical protein
MGYHDLAFLLKRLEFFIVEVLLQEGEGEMRQILELWQIGGGDAVQDRQEQPLGIAVGDHNDLPDLLHAVCSHFSVQHGNQILQTARVFLDVMGIEFVEESARASSISWVTILIPRGHKVEDVVSHPRFLRQWVLDQIFEDLFAAVQVCHMSSRW